MTISSAVVADLAARVAAESQTPAQKLHADLLAALNQALADLEAAQQAADAQAIAALQASIDDLTRQLQAARDALTIEEQELASAIAKDAATIAGLQASNDSLTASNALLTAEKAKLQADLTTAQADAATANILSVNLTAQLREAAATIETSNKTIANLNDLLDAANLKIAQLSVNHAPVWTATIPMLNFTQGVPEFKPIGQFVEDPDGDPLTITQTLGALPQGVTLVRNAAGIYGLQYDGVGPVGLTTGNALKADDGKP